MSNVYISKAGVIAVTIIVFVVFVVGLSCVYLPKAKILVTPSTYTKEANQIIVLSGEKKEPDFVKYILPAKVIEKTVEEKEIIIREGGNKKEDFAKGIVELFNDQDKEQSLLPKTHLRYENSDIFFLTDDIVHIPAKSSVKVSVTAEKQGAFSNVQAGKLIVDKLPASMQEVVYAQSKDVFTGGEIFEKPLSDKEITDAKERVKQKALEQAKRDIATETKGVQIQKDLLSINVEEERVSAEKGSQTTTFTVFVKIKVSGFLVDENDLLSLTLLALRSSQKNDEEFISYNPDSFTVKLLKIDLNRKEARLQGKLKGNFAQKTETTLFDVTNLAGRTESEVQEYFSQFDSIEKIEIELSPFWVTTIPSRPLATEVVMEKIKQ